jgi:hypothetical protein
VVVCVGHKLRTLWGNNMPPVPEKDRQSFKTPIAAFLNYPARLDSFTQRVEAELGLALELHSGTRGDLN